jgi:GH15 family glucan-1,4-alpha-glucosidase
MEQPAATPQPQFQSPGDRTDYPSIGSLAAVGDGRSLALFAADASVEWFCPGRFDAPPLIWPLLDRQQGGRLRIAPPGAVDTRMRYLDETAVLEYEWRSAAGEARARVCMEWPAPPGRQHLLWVIDGVRGRCEIGIEFEPRPDFGRASCRAQSSTDGLRLDAGAHTVALHADCPLRAAGSGWAGRLAIGAGERAVFSLSVGSAGEPLSPLPSPSIARRIDATTDAWRAWGARFEWQGRDRAAVVRSAIALKLLINEATGAVVAAGTTSLPETLGGARNWDYRYTWFRDAGMTLNALHSLGCEQEAHRWAEWIQQAVERHGTHLMPVYDVDGHPVASERRVPGVDGYRGSRPVREGNAAGAQFQLDLYGDLLNCVEICDSMHDDVMLSHWSALRAAADFVAANWRRPDQGIWEMRCEPRHFVHSKVMAWAALQRALWLMQRPGLDGDRARWTQERDALREDVLRRGLDRGGRHFVQAYGSDTVDASLLLLARAGFVDGGSALFRNTLEAIREGLGVGPDKTLLRRYGDDAADGIGGSEGAFLICSFWMVDALVRAGEPREARALFERLLALQGDCGLYAEEMDPQTGEQLGNFPQAFSHVGLINAALALRDAAPASG